MLFPISIVHKSVRFWPEHHFQGVIGQVALREVDFFECQRLLQQVMLVYEPFKRCHMAPFISFFHLYFQEKKLLPNKSPPNTKHHLFFHVLFQESAESGCFHCLSGTVQPIPGETYNGTATFPARQQPGGHVVLPDISGLAPGMVDEFVAMFTPWSLLVMLYRHFSSFLQNPSSSFAPLQSSSIWLSLKRSKRCECQHGVPTL